MPIVLPFYKILFKFLHEPCEQLVLQTKIYDWNKKLSKYANKTKHLVHFFFLGDYI